MIYNKKKSHSKMKTNIVRGLANNKTFGHTPDKTTSKIDYQTKTLKQVDLTTTNNKIKNRITQ